jgi:HEAT repeat protein
LIRIAAHENPDVRRSVILNKQAPLAVLKPLLDDPYPINRAMLAGHPALTVEVRRYLLDDPEPQVRFIAAQALAKKDLKQ